MAEWQTRTVQGRVGFSYAGSNPVIRTILSRCVGMADETDSKSVGRKAVWVQVPLPAPKDFFVALLKATFI